LRLETPMSDGHEKETSITAGALESDQNEGGVRGSRTLFDGPRRGEGMAAEPVRVRGGTVGGVQTINHARKDQTTCLRSGRRRKSGVTKKLKKRNGAKKYTESANNGTEM